MPSKFNQKLEVLEAPEADSMSESKRLDMAVDQAIAAHDGDPRRTVQSLLLVHWQLEARSRRASFTRGVLYGRFKCYSG